jgi:glycosyltransferase involved in cell wall biosynthesis
MAKRLTAAIYDRWFPVLGGGEQAVLGMARVLVAMGYETSVISHLPVDVQAVDKKLGQSCVGIKFRQIPFAYDYDLSDMTQEYDLFVNHSFLDYIVPRSQHSILAVFFPSAIPSNPVLKVISQQLVPFLRRHLLYIAQSQVAEGITHAAWVWNHPIQTADVRLDILPWAYSTIDSLSWRVDGQPARVQRYNSPFQSIVRFRIERTDQKPWSLLEVEKKPGSYPAQISVQSITAPTLGNIIFRWLARWPRAVMRLQGGHNLTDVSIVRKYDQILANSQFTQHWIKQYWEIDSTVLYPPVPLSETATTAKLNRIVHIGRFFAGGYNKKQLDMVRTFRLLREKYPEVADWELHLIGSVADGSVHHEYAQQVAAAAQGLPVFIHHHLNREQMNQLVGSARILWHANGWGDNLTNHPIAAEHFGITIVEAMSQGCVPVVFAAGGVTEIVQKEDGFTWTSESELQTYTYRLMTEPDLWQQMSKNSQKRSQDFSPEIFAQNCRTIITEVMT